MPRQQLSQNREYAEAFETMLSRVLLTTILFGLPEDEDGCEPEVNVIETYKEAGVLTRDRGLVLQMSDGAQVRLTIQAYTPAGTR